MYKTRTSHNWKTKSGSWDTLNLQFLDFDGDFPFIKAVSRLPTQIKVVKINNYKNFEKANVISSFVDDYILERFYNNPLKYVYLFENKIVLSPDFTCYYDAPKPLNMFSIYKNRLVGYVWQKAGVQVIPTCSWGGESTFSFCFEGLEEESIVAVSNIGARNDLENLIFERGLIELQKRIKPKQILFLCNNKYKSYYQCKYNNIIFLNFNFRNNGR